MSARAFLVVDVHVVNKRCAPVYAMWCVFRKGLTFSPFKATLPGFGGWRCPGQTEVICHSDQPSQLWDGAIKLTGFRYPRPYLVFGFPSSCFCTHGTVWYLSLCIQSDKYHEVGEEWAGRQRWCSRVRQCGVKDFSKSAHKSRMLTNTKEIYGALHYSSEDGFFKVPSGCAIRNAPKSPNFRLENLQKTHILNSLRLLGLTAVSRSCTLHCFYPLCLFFMSLNWCTSGLQCLAGHLWGCFHAQTPILCSDLAHPIYWHARRSTRQLEIVWRAHWSKERPFLSKL